ncbi:MAG: hypothetical protein ACFCD0_29255 [Gemmataceae bacterium]
MSDSTDPKPSAEVEKDATPAATVATAPESPKTSSTQLVANVSISLATVLGIGLCVVMIGIMFLIGETLYAPTATPETPTPKSTGPAATEIFVDLLMALAIVLGIGLCVVVVPLLFSIGDIRHVLDKTALGTALGATSSESPKEVTAAEATASETGTNEAAVTTSPESTESVTTTDAITTEAEAPEAMRPESTEGDTTAEATATEAETTEAPSTQILANTVTILATVLGIGLCVVMIAVMFFIGETQYSPDQVDQREKLKKLQTQHDTKLNSYGEMKKGTFRIPIEKAMQKVVEEAKPKQSSK